MWNTIKKNGLAKYVISQGGDCKPLIVPVKDLKGLSITNPSVLSTGSRLLVNLRNINYVLYHSEKNVFLHECGPLQYLHPEQDRTLTTHNFLCELDDCLDINRYEKIDTSHLDVPPKWHFIGLEDIRLVEWNNKLYGCGVRRDTTNNGQGRMELSEINEYSEISRTRIPTIDHVDTYCEKNWMPIVDAPYHFIIWTNPTRIVKYDVEINNTVLIYESNKYVSGVPDFRGGSQVIPYNNGYLAIIHESILYSSELNRKNGIYRHRIVFWDKEWNLKFTKPFSFLTGHIEFCCGATFHHNNLLVTFGFQDNCAFILRIPLPALQSILENIDERAI